MHNRTGVQTAAHSLIGLRGVLFKIAMHLEPTPRKVLKAKPGRNPGVSHIGDEIVWACYLLRDIGIKHDAIARYMNLPVGTVRGFLSGVNRGDLLARYDQGIPMNQAIRFY